MRWRSRRAILGGAGALVALPFLKSLLPRAARAERTPPPRRLIAFFVPNGIHMQAWTPAAYGPAFTLTPIMAPLAPVKDKLLVISGLSNLPNVGPSGGAHTYGTSAFLTCTGVGPSPTEVTSGISMDQVAAAHLGGLTRFPSLQFGTDGGTDGGSCDSGFPCAYIRSISWAGPGQPLGKMVSPRTIFDVLFGGFDPDATAAERARRLARRTSVLDYVAAQTGDVMAALGKSDQAKLDEYLTGVRELELRVGEAGTCPQASVPQAALDLPTRAKQVLDLMAVAVQCDLTRVMTFMLQNGFAFQAMPWLGFPEGHHSLSHHVGNAALYPKLIAIATWEVEQLSYFLQKLDAIDEGEGTTALDNSLVYFGSECADGNIHEYVGLPVLVAGSAGGAFLSGQHVRHDAPVANLFTSMMRAVGVPNERFGDKGTGPLPGLNLGV